MKKILWVDDNEELLKNSSWFFSQNNFEIIPATNITSAFKQLREQELEGVLLDVDLGNGEDGLVLLREIQYQYPTLPIIILTGYPNYYLHQPLALKHGAKAYFPKIAFNIPLDEVAQKEFFQSLHNTFENYSFSEIPEIMNEEPCQSILFLHLSDIHFYKKTIAGKYDLDEGLRRQLEVDAQSVSEELGNVQSILVTGDIAFSGDKNEYKKAKEWLFTLANLVNCPKDKILTVPGNHDVERSIYESNEFYKHAINNISNQSNDNDVNLAIKSLYESKQADEMLYEPIKNYNDFAKEFRCHINTSRQYWEKIFNLVHNIKIYIRGLNTTLASSKNDSDEKRNLFLGLKQIDLPTEKRTINFVLGHHPPDWLKDKKQVETYLNKRGNIQLFGHKHEQETFEINNQLRLIAGAVHPDRNESNWIPAYNFIKVLVKSNKKVQIRIYPRIWSDTEFIADLNKAGVKGFKSVDFSIKD